jgi:hypothetical protein
VSKTIKAGDLTVGIAFGHPGQPGHPTVKVIRVIGTVFGMVSVVLADPREPTGRRADLIGVNEVLELR